MTIATFRDTGELVPWGGGEWWPLGSPRVSMARVYAKRLETAAELARRGTADYRLGQAMSGGGQYGRPLHVLIVRNAHELGGPRRTICGARLSRVTWHLEPVPADLKLCGKCERLVYMARTIRRAVYLPGDS